MFHLADFLTTSRNDVSPLINNGPRAVDAFFMLSGFVMMMLAMISAY